MTQSNNDIEELEELLTELEGQEAQLVSPYAEDDDAVTQLMDAPLSDQEWMVQVTALDRRMMSTDALLAELQSGRLSNKALVWRGGMEDWLPAARVDALAQASLAAPSPPPRMGVGSLPPPPTPLAAPPVWSSLPSVPLGPPPVAMPPNVAMSSLPASMLSPSAQPNLGLPPPAPSSYLAPSPQMAANSHRELPRPMPAPLQAPPSGISLGNTSRPVAVDFDEMPFESPSPMRGKRSLMALSAVAILAVFITVYAMSSKSDGTANAEAPVANQPQAVSALQPAAVPEHKAEVAAPAPKPAEPKPEPAKPMAAALAMNDAPTVSAPAPRATNAPARYSPRSEYRRRSRSSSAAERAEESDSETTPEVSNRAVPAKASPPAEEAPAPSEVTSGSADDDADATEPPKSTSKSSNTFNREAAKNALDEAATQARNCRPAGGPSGTGRVQVRYEPSGKVANVSILTGKFENTTAGSCVRMLFRRAKVPEFTGAPVVVVNKSFEIP